MKQTLIFTLAMWVTRLTWGANATLGLMIALRQAAGTRRGGLAIMPAFTFAAAAHAAEWAGLTRKTSC